MGCLSILLTLPINPILLTFLNLTLATFTWNFELFFKVFFRDGIFHQDYENHASIPRLTRSQTHKGISLLFSPHGLDYERAYNKLSVTLAVVVVEYCNWIFPEMWCYKNMCGCCAYCRRCRLLYTANIYSPTYIIVVCTYKSHNHHSMEKRMTNNSGSWRNVWKGWWDGMNWKGEFYSLKFNSFFTIFTIKMFSNISVIKWMIF